MFSAFPLETYSLNVDHNNTIDSFAHHNLVHLHHQQQHMMEPDRSTQSQTNSLSPTNVPNDLATVKKLNHNANERDRRKKINNLYASLRSLLPHVDQMVLSLFLQKIRIIISTKK